MSFYSSKLYIDVREHWRGIGLSYLFLLIIIISTPLSVRTVIDFNQRFNTQMLNPLKKLPDINIIKGNVFFTKTMPYYIRDEKNQVIAIIDTAGTVSKIDNTYPKLSVLITKDTFYFRPPDLSQIINPHSSLNNNTIYTHPFGQDVSGAFVGEDWIKSSGVSKIKILAQLIILPTIPLFYVVVYALVLILLALLGQLIAYVCWGVRLSYKESSRLIAVASTPLIVTFFFFMSTQLVFPGLSFVYAALLILYGFYALKSSCLPRNL